MEPKQSAKSEDNFDEETRIAQAIIECTYCKIKPSSIDGVGVFAVRYIPRLINIFPDCSRYDKYFKVKKEIFDVADPEVRSMVHDFFSGDDKTYHIPYRTLNSLNISAYVNHSDSPNAAFDSRGFIYSTKDIENGEEVVVDYNDFWNQKEKLP
jgi:hypothetical protein